MGISIISYLHAVTGWRRAGLAFACGGVMSLAMPPYDIFPLLWLCLPALIILLQGAKNYQQAFAVGWSFAFGFLAFSLYWIAASMTVDLHHFWWAIPLSVIALPAAFALYYGIACVIAWRIGLSGVAGAVAFALLWFLADDARGHMFTGFPWNLTGYAWSGVLPVMQTLSVTGIYGLSLLTNIAASLPAALTGGAKYARAACLCGIGLFVLLAAGGEARLLTVTTGTTPAVRLRLVQPDTDQATKWRMDEREADFRHLLDMTSAPAAKPVTHVIWPETASTFYLSEDAAHRADIAARIPAAASVITGVIRRQMDQNDQVHFYNSLAVVDGLGRVVAGYDKAHLVPFGEYMPLRRWLPPGIQAVAADMADFTPGEGTRSLRVLGLPPFSPLICYEAIFPGAVADESDRPDFLLNLTNDAWYGHTIGPYQHFAIARARAIEEGLPLVRAANTGISGVVDPLGRIKARLGLGKKGFIDSDLPLPLPPTLFSLYGEAIDFSLLFMTILIIIVLRRIGKYEKPNKV